MRTLVLVLVLALPLLLLPACGGGGGGGGPGSGVLGIQTLEVAPLGPNYEAVFSCVAHVEASTAPIGLNLTGSLRIENTGVQMPYPVDGSRSGWRIATTLVLNVPAVVRAQYPQLPPTITVAYTEFVEMAADGSWYSLGAETTDTFSGSSTTYRTWAASPLRMRAPQLVAGQVIDNPTTDMLSDDLSTTVGSRRLVRTVAPNTDVIPTPLGAVECFVVDEVETLTVPDAGLGPTPVTYRRWERPDYGVLRLELDQFTWSGDVNGEATTVTVSDVVCTLQSVQR